ncbi:uncharacterized protein LOC113562699 [Ooceraea biroi]|uniref:uncharacterized protein LOC113562699 n=1 Tax=Ooceraea biroi TaxID=2015173 RepID=UPI000F080C49|nr:uncharacterized protein LOC113562699 [Ooceraea biroi]
MNHIDISMDPASATSSNNRSTSLSNSTTSTSTICDEDNREQNDDNNLFLEEVTLPVVLKDNINTVEDGQNPTECHTCCNACREKQNMIINKLNLVINLLTNPETNQASTTETYNNLLPDFQLATTDEFLKFEQELQTDREIPKQFVSPVARPINGSINGTDQRTDQRVDQPTDRRTTDRRTDRRTNGGDQRTDQRVDQRTDRNGKSNPRIWSTCNPTRGRTGYRYILTIIDALSKYAWAVPLKRKSGSEVAEMLARIFRDDRRCSRNLQTDEGKEFYNAQVRELARKRGINHYSTHSVMKASIVERFNRTLKNEMWKVFTLNGSYEWTDALSRLVRKYNARRHRTIAMRPVDVTPATAAQLLSTVYKRVKIAAPAKFRAGDTVRVSKHKTIFAKGYTPNWTTEVFTVTKVQRTNPATYLLQDYRGNPISGGFYEHELLRARHPDVYLVEKVLRRRGNDVYVKWLGMDASHNSWISRDNVL